MDVHPQMLLLALRIVGKCLLDIDTESDALKISAAVAAFMVAPPPMWVPAGVLNTLRKIPFGPAKRIQKGVDDLDAILYGLIAERRRNPGDRGDLLSMLMSSIDDEASSAGEQHMNDKQVRDECLTVLLAGHETTANALSFTLWLLAKHPDAQEAGHAEAVEVLTSERPPTATEYGRLTLTHNIFAEARRLMPTVWVLGRSCGPDPYDFHGFRIPPGATLLAPQAGVHRDARFWDEPDTFNPARFGTNEGQARHKFAYFPFGGGSRQCIGEGLAWMEGVLALAVILRDWRVQLPGDAPDALPISVAVNLRPKTGVRLLLERRG